MLGAARKYRWYAPLAALATVAALVAGGVLPPGGQSGIPRPPGVLPPGSSGSITHHSWWDPRGWHGGGDVPKSSKIPATGGPQLQVGRRPRQVAAPAPRRVGEVVGKRTENARVYRLSNGKLQAAISAVPVNYRGTAGHWQPIDTTVRRVSEPGYVY